MDATGDQTKANLRAQAKRARRDRLESGDSFESTQLCAGLSAFLSQWHAQQVRNGRSPLGQWTIAFVAMPGEPDLKTLVCDPSLEGVTRFATTRTPAESMDLSIHPMGSTMERHRYGFDQPVEESKIVDDGLIGAVLVPGLVFDEKGGRLGFGAGYYDRLLERLLRARKPGSLAIVGVCDGFGLADGSAVDPVPMQAHDISMTHLATTSGVRTIGAD